MLSFNSKFAFGFVSYEENGATSEAKVTSDESTDFDKDYKDYISILDEYGRAHESFITAKSFYLRTKTQRAENEALQAGIKLLQVRDSVILNYLKMIYAKLAETEGVGGEVVTKMKIQIDQETKWFEDHRSSLSTSKSLDDLLSDTREAEGRYKSTTGKLYYQILLGISHAQTTDYTSRLSELMEKLEAKISVIKQEERQEYKFTDSKIVLLERWIDDSKVMIARSEEKRKEAFPYVFEMKTSQVTSYNQIYQTQLNNLVSSSQYMKDALYKLLEVVSEIKTAEEIKN
jgi:hypothetical protein